MIGLRNAAAAALVVAALATVLSASPGHAGKKRAPSDDAAYTYITVSSQYDPSQTISAPVRRLPQGDQVRLPGGTWVWCGINCYHTLRNQTVDFWRRYDAPVTLP